mmetsp:Transcript_32428/g.49610  ORF Transcript_32428/g.49610 Transcript_32428/m.49610 type:complete len:249 (+) Transcript_32428:625-1371(+)|eukprot:CAMPEP_0170495014 /NCGR_PEP_ID=MMETSP0208-20121228/14968_1 /TAXON_ID=197538 /ORGANISM="Strombidium inclinatum, Strain S3" /LENGTH=248 /DNA_ID=CAMNT_0010771149 /DNA_START=624 /DNA_END=1370 /DNA_ORIENTATION=-
MHPAGARQFVIQRNLRRLYSCDRLGLGSTPLASLASLAALSLDLLLCRRNIIGGEGSELSLGSGYGIGVLLEEAVIVYFIQFHLRQVLIQVSGLESAWLLLLLRWLLVTHLRVGATAGGQRLLLLELLEFVGEVADSILFGRRVGVNLLQLVSLVLLLLQTLRRAHQVIPVHDGVEDDAVFAYYGRASCTLAVPRAVILHIRRVKLAGVGSGVGRSVLVQFFEDIRDVAFLILLAFHGVCQGTYFDGT